MYVWTGEATFASCTVYSNTATTGANLYINSGSVCTWETTITDTAGSGSLSAGPAPPPPELPSPPRPAPSSPSRTRGPRTWRKA